ncbi:hypothetical protein U5922_012880 [Aquicoccus sp. G2-2]|uniref:hypothetical protein n=1 Tax=Aquicoccus sp. G2-2 TaxID=3092120 RepID=UPI002ADF1930|nr:hypothetical protein [Aquicoccus sp. G2-2]MEA1114306.1 hypothetical protein [Aquicoccus sp. G2-2]
MSHYVGLDVSVKEVSIFVVDADGEVLNRASVPTEPGAIADYLAQETAIQTGAMISTSAQC